MNRTYLIVAVTTFNTFTLTNTASAQAPVSPCGVEVPGYTDRQWQLVRADGFTFCVPASWQARGKGRGNVDAKEWTGDGGSIAWGTGPFRERASMAQEQPQVIATVRADQLASPTDPPSPPAETIKETIDGRPAELWTFESRGKRQTRIKWAGPAGYIRGEAVNDDQVQLHFAIFRTVRFNSR